MSGKSRWLFAASFPKLGEIPPQFVKLITRPEWSEETKSPTPNGSFTTSYIGFVQSTCPDLFEILGGFYKFGSDLFTEEGKMLEEIAQYMGSATLDFQVTVAPKCPNCNHSLGLFFGSSGPLETIERWSFSGVWPHSVNFGELCYSSSEEIDLEITWRYKTCEYEHLMLKEKQNV